MLVTDYIFNASDWDIQFQWSMNEKRMSASKCNLALEEVLKNIRLIDSSTNLMWESEYNKGVLYKANFEQFKIVKAPFGKYNLMVIFTSAFEKEGELFTRRKYNNDILYDKSWWEMRKEWDDFFKSCIGPNKNLKNEEDEDDDDVEPVRKPHNTDIYKPDYKPGQKVTIHNIKTGKTEEATVHTADEDDWVTREALRRRRLALLHADIDTAVKDLHKTLFGEDEEEDDE